MNRAIVIIILVVSAVSGGYFLLKGGYLAPASSPTVQPTATPEVPVQQPPSTEIPPGTKEMIVSGTEFSFSPSNITVKAGEKIKILFKNNGGSPHNLVIEKIGSGTKTIGSGQTDAVEFTAPFSVVYTFFCSVPGHRTAGMEGSIKVE